MQWVQPHRAAAPEPQDPQVNDVHRLDSIPGKVGHHTIIIYISFPYFVIIDGISQTVFGKSEHYVTLYLLCRETGRIATDANSHCTEVLLY
jgi:hypothetical protein